LGAQERKVKKIGRTTPKVSEKKRIKRREWDLGILRWFLRNHMNGDYEKGRGVRTKT